MGANRTAKDSTRERIIAATLELLERDGIAAASTRAIAAAAQVQAPTIYREFGDKQGLLQTVIERGFADYLGTKSVHEPTGHPVDDLRRGWDLHIDFALAHPSLYTLMSTQPRSVAPSRSAVAGWAVLASIINEIARASLLAVDEVEAARLIQAAGSGTAMLMISLPEAQRHRSLSDRSREAAIAGIVGGSGNASESGTATAAIMLRANLADLHGFTDGERHLLDDWLARIIHHSGDPSTPQA